MTQCYRGGGRKYILGQLKVVLGYALSGPINLSLFLAWTQYIMSYPTFKTMYNLSLYTVKLIARNVRSLYTYSICHRHLCLFRQADGAKSPWLAGLISGTRSPWIPIVVLFLSQLLCIRYFVYAWHLLRGDKDQFLVTHLPPPWLLVGTPLALGPELASRLADQSLLWRMSLFIFDILFFITLDVWVMIFMASPLWLALGPWSL